MHISDIDRGDILVFSDPNPSPADDRGVIGGFFHWLGEGIGVAQPEDEDFIKRVGALPGRHGRSGRGVLYVTARRSMSRT